MKIQKINSIEDKSKEFLIEFFKNSKIKDEKGVLTISEVAVEFENFVGKKAPYKFVFDINAHNKYKDSELIMQGSYFLLAIKDYLEDKGQTCLSKINIKQDLVEIKKNIKLKKYKILSIEKNTFDYLYQFSFLSNYQYLNDKKQTTTRILVKNKETVDLDITRLNLNKGNKDEIASLDISEQYDFAKKILDDKCNKEIKPIKVILKEKLDKELSRVKEHYFKQIEEKDEEIESCVNKIKMLQSKLRHTSYDREIHILKRMINESNVRLEMLKKKSYRERLKTEENFHINDEVEKHVLSIKNNLINVTVFYYPVIHLEVSEKGKKKIILWDPLLEKIV